MWTSPFYGSGPRSPEHRVFYIARFEEGVYVLHAFEKRSRKTRAKEIEVARIRLREALTTRRRVR